MIINEKEFSVKRLNYVVRSAIEYDAKDLSELRLQIYGETENLDREKGEAFIDISRFQQIKKLVTEKSRNLFLVGVVHNQIVEFSRCEEFYLN